MSRGPEGRGAPNQNKPKKQSFVWGALTVPCPWAPEGLATRVLTLILLNRYVYPLLFSSSESTTAVTDEPKKDEATTDVPVLSNGELKGSAYWTRSRRVRVTYCR